MVIVEGPDGAGKSTLVQRLIKDFPDDLVEGERSTANRDHLWKVTRRDTYKALVHALEGGQPRIWDRLFYSEFVYAPVTKRKCEFNDRERDFISFLLRQLDCPLIVCIPPLGDILRNVEKSKQMKGVAAHIRPIVRRYYEMFANHPTAMWHDYTGTFNDVKGYYEYESIATVIHAYLKRREERHGSSATPSRVSPLAAG